MGFCQGDLGIVASWGDGLGEIVENMVHYGVVRERSGGLSRGGGVLDHEWDEMPNSLESMVVCGIFCVVVPFKSLGNRQRSFLICVESHRINVYPPTYVIFK